LGHDPTLEKSLCLGQNGPYTLADRVAPVVEYPTVGPVNGPREKGFFLVQGTSAVYGVAGIICSFMIMDRHGGFPDGWLRLEDSE